MSEKNFMTLKGGVLYSWISKKIIFIKTTLLGVKSCEKSIARIPEA
jgi:hypothetical protein